MNERDELVRIYVETLNEGHGMVSRTVQGNRAADAILAAGWVKPRTITAVEELDKLANGSVILDRSGISLHKNEFTGWRASNGAKGISLEMLAEEGLPATVLHEP